MFTPHPLIAMQVTPPGTSLSAMDGVSKGVNLGFLASHTLSIADNATVPSLPTLYPLRPPQFPGVREEI